MTMQDKLLDIRFAFERDMTRRGGLAYGGSEGRLTECVICEEDFDKKRSNEITCSPECKRLRANERQMKHDTKVRLQTRERVRQYRQRNPYKTQNKKKIAGAVVTTPDPYTNLMLAVVQNAFFQEDSLWLLENEDTFTDAILGDKEQDNWHWHLPPLCVTVVVDNTFYARSGHWTPEAEERFVRKRVRGCQLCGKRQGAMHRDHHFPKSLGGTGDPENQVCLCKEDNLKKGAHLPEDFYTPSQLQRIEEELHDVHDQRRSRTRYEVCVRA